jgi:hypothetical protein
MGLVVLEAMKINLNDWGETVYDCNGRRVYGLIVPPPMIGGKNPNKSPTHRKPPRLEITLDPPQT